MRRTLRCTLLALAACLLVAAPAGAAARLTIRGAGFGHGVGMSQYGALGYAQHGWRHDAILAHYYTGTDLGATDPARPVRVLLQSTATPSFSGAARAGSRALSPARTYRVRARGATQVDLLTEGGRRIATFTAPLQVAGADGTLVLGGPAANGRVGGRYRGTLSFSPGAAGLDVVNTLGLDDYVRGVVPVESPASWPLEALKAQAVAARTYAITTRRAGSFDQYADTRSQVYGGVGVQTAATDRAVALTRGQVVTYAGEPVVTYFFSTSGGRTEDVESSVLGTTPRPWLRSVADPYDAVSPRHRWGPTTMRLRRAGARLSGLVKGAFRGIEVLRRGRSPRVVLADVVGTRGRTRVSGATLRARFGLYDTWAYFTSIGIRRTRPPADPVPAQPLDAGGGTGGVRAARVRAVATLTGAVLPAHPGAEVQVQLRRGSRFTTVASATVGADGRYRTAVTRRGAYRVVYWGDAGPTLRVR